MADTLRQLLDTNRAYLLDGSFKTYLAPDIPVKKARAAIASYAHRIQEQDILLLLDDTLFGSADNGLILTENAVYLKPPFGEPAFYKLEGINDIRATKAVILINGLPIIDLAMAEKKTVTRLCDVLTQYLSSRRQTASPAAAVPVPTAAPAPLPSATTPVRPVSERGHIAVPISNTHNFPHHRVENSHFYRYRSRYIAYLRENVDKLQYRMNLDLYDSFMSIATQSPAARNPEAALTWLVSDDETLFQSYILTCYYTGALMSQHLPDEDVLELMDPLLQVVFELAKEELSRQPMSLGVAVDPGRAIMSSPRVQDFQRTYEYYKRALRSGGQGSQLVPLWFVDHCDAALSNRYGNDYRQILQLAEQQGQSFPACLQQYAQITQQNVERILIDFFSAIWQ